MNNNTENPVVITQIWDTRNPEIVNVALTQEQEREVKSASNLLSITLTGVNNVNSSKSSRNTVVPMSRQFLDDNQLDIGSMLPEKYNASIVIREYTKGEVLTSDDKVYITDSNTTNFIPWETANSRQQPKRAGKDGGICCIDDKPIYRVGYLAMGDMPRIDKLIPHNSIKVASEGIDQESKVGKLNLGL